MYKQLSKKWLPWQRHGINQHTIVFLDKFYEKSPNFVSVGVFLVMIQMFEISGVTLCPPSPSPCKIGINAALEQAPHLE